MRNVIAIMLTCVFCVPSIAQEVVDAPKNLVGFLKPGMHLGLVSHFPESDRITLRIYSEEDLAIAIDSQKLSLEQLCTKYERVASQLERTRKEILTSLESNPPQLPEGKTYGEPVISLRVGSRETFFKIVATGDDYILVTSIKNPARRSVLATRYISSIDWQDELAFTWSIPQIDKKDKTKP